MTFPSALVVALIFLFGLMTGLLVVWHVLRSLLHSENFWGGFLNRAPDDVVLGINDVVGKEIALRVTKMRSRFNWSHLDNEDHDEPPNP